MINKLFILIKLAIKLARSDALKVVAKIHEPPLIIKILVRIFSISFFKKDSQNLNLSDEEFSKVSKEWSEGILKVFNSFPRFDWEKSQ